MNASALGLLPNYLGLSFYSHIKNAKPSKQKVFVHSHRSLVKFLFKNVHWQMFTVGDSLFYLLPFATFLAVPPASLSAATLLFTYCLFHVYCNIISFSWLQLHTFLITWIFSFKNNQNKEMLRLLQCSSLLDFSFPAFISVVLNIAILVFYKYKTSPPSQV